MNSIGRGDGGLWWCDPIYGEIRLAKSWRIGKFAPSFLPMRLLRSVFSSVTCSWLIVLPPVGRITHRIQEGGFVLLVCGILSSTSKMLTAPVQTTKTQQGSRRLIFSLQDRPGALTGALELLKKHGLNMSHIESRPSITADHVYDFFVALSAESASPEALAKVIDELKTSGAGDISLLSETKTTEDESTYCE